MKKHNYLSLMVIIFLCGMPSLRGMNTLTRNEKHRHHEQEKTIQCEQNSLLSEGSAVISKELLLNALQCLTYSNQEIEQLSQEKKCLVTERCALMQELDHQQKMFAFQNQVLRTNLQQKNEIISAVSACVPFAMGDTPISDVKMRLNRVDTLRVSEEYYKELLEEWQRFGIFVEKGKDIPVLYVQSVFYVDKKKNDWVRNWRSLPPFFLQDIITAQNKLGLLAREKIYQGLDEFKFPGWVPAEIVDGESKIKLSVLGVPFECEVVFEDKNLLKSKSTFWRPIALTFLGTSCAWIIGLLIYKCNADPMFFPILIEQLRSVI